MIKQNYLKKMIAIAAILAIVTALFSGCRGKIETAQPNVANDTPKENTGPKAEENGLNAEEKESGGESKSDAVNETQEGKSEIKYRLYENTRLGYNIFYPDIFTMFTESENGDGIFMKSPDGLYTLKIWGAEVDEKSTGQSLLAEAKNRVSYIKDEYGDERCYRLEYEGGKNGNDLSFYEFGFTLSGSFCAFILSYPVEAEGSLEDIIRRMSNHLEKGDAFRYPNAPSEIGYAPLLDALILSETLHYDNFENEPDETTITITLYELVAHNDFRWKHVMEMEDGAYYFSHSPGFQKDDEDDRIYVSQDTLYEDYFANGKYKFPPQEMNHLIERTGTGIAVYLYDRIYHIEYTVKNVTKVDDQLVMEAAITRKVMNESNSTLIGDAVITLKVDDSAYYGYKIVSFKPKYSTFDDIILR